MSHIETVVSTRNSTTAPLGGGATFTGQVEDLTSFSELDINVAGAPSNAPGTLYFEFSPDGTHWDVSIPLALTGPISLPIPLRVVLPKFRVRYVNGATPQSELRLTVVFHRTGLKHITRFLNQPLSDAEPVTVQHSVVAGLAPNGGYVNVRVDADGNLVDRQSGIVASGTPVVASTVAVQIVAANAARKGLIVTNNGPGTVRFGASDVTSAKGAPLAAGEKVAFILPACPTSAIYAIRQDGVDGTVVAMELL